MTTYASQNMGAKDLNRVDRGVYTALGIGCVYSIASFLILRVTDKLLIGLFLDAGETAIMANAQSFIFWNSVFYIPLAVLIIYRYTIQGLGFSGLAMFAGVAEMIARAWWASGSCRCGATLRPASQARWHGSLPASSSFRPTLWCANACRRKWTSRRNTMPAPQTLKECSQALLQRGAFLLFGL